MTLIVQANGKITIPPRLRSKVGIKEGVVLDAKVSSGTLVLTPKVPMVAEDEYTPAQRRFLEQRFAEADEDRKNGRVYGPFTGPEAVKFLKRELKVRSKKK